MARMNPKRRLIARLKADIKARHAEKVQTNAEPLQGGKVKSVLAQLDNKAGYARPPRDMWEGTGSAGKIVNGKFRPTKPGTRVRFAKS